MNPATPYPITPTLSCVERVRKMFTEISRRRLLEVTALQGELVTPLTDWIFDIHTNVQPIFLLKKDILEQEWLRIAKDPITREFVLGVTFELRIRCFEETDDFEAYIDQTAVAMTQFNDALSVIGPTLLADFTLKEKAVELLAANPWALVIILIEQLTLNAIGVDEALAMVSNKNGRG